MVTCFVVTLMPRSPSRDVVDRFTGNRAYFHRADPLRRWKNLVALGAVGLVFGWLAVEFAFGERARSAHTHGELAGPHAAFDSNCQACHLSHSPGEFFSNPFSVLKTHDRWHDLTCTKCHAGPVHHATAKDKSFHEQCSNCHHDHNGRGFSLVKMDDAHCTKCHENLPDTHEKGTSSFAPKITGFAKDHPEFQSLKVERGLKFSHAFHMSPGLVYSANDQHKWTQESLAKQLPSTRDRYPSTNGNTTDPIQLNCATCHQLDAGRTTVEDRTAAKQFDMQVNTIRGAPRNSILPSRSEGATYLPVNFDVHCKACHPLRSPTAVSAGKPINEFFVPHRRHPDAIRPLLRGEYATALTADKTAAANVPLGPGGRLDPANAVIATFATELDRLTETALHAIDVSCNKCHYAAGGGKTDVLPLPDKSVWFEHAKFNHSRHRGLACSACHPGTEGSFAANGQVNEREPVLIAGVKTCQACHAKAGQVIELPNGQTASAAGVRHSCTDCHRYHNGDRPRQGLGSPHRDPKDPQSLEQFLRGGKDQP